MLAGAMVRLADQEGGSCENMRRRLTEDNLKPWRHDMWRIPQVDGEHVARVEDGFELYAETPDPKRPMVCFGEYPARLIGEVRQPIRPVPAQLSALIASIAATVRPTGSCSSTPISRGAM